MEAQHRNVLLLRQMESQPITTHTNGSCALIRQLLTESSHLLV